MKVRELDVITERAMRRGRLRKIIAWIAFQAYLTLTIVSVVIAVGDRKSPF